MSLMVIININHLMSLCLIHIILFHHKFLWIFQKKRTNRICFFFWKTFLEFNSETLIYFESNNLMMILFWHKSKLFLFVLYIKFVCFFPNNENKIDKLSKDKQVKLKVHLSNVWCTWYFQCFFFRIWFDLLIIHTLYTCDNDNDSFTFSQSFNFHVK